jgi:hypothetical protein
MAFKLLEMDGNVALGTWILQVASNLQEIGSGIPSPWLLLASGGKGSCLMADFVSRPLLLAIWLEHGVGFCLLNFIPLEHLRVILSSPFLVKRCFLHYVPICSFLLLPPLLTIEHQPKEFHSRAPGVGGLLLSSLWNKLKATRYCSRWGWLIN